MIAAKIIEWATLGKVVASALVAGVVVTLGFSWAIHGAVRSAEMRRDGRALEATGFAAIGIVGALVCLALVAGGIIVMTSK
jgi:hypothetical protein